jgi:C1A family cysteine protease
MAGIEDSQRRWSMAWREVGSRRTGVQAVLTVGLLALAVTAAICSSVLGAPPSKPSVAPPNPEYVKYMERLQIEGPLTMLIADGHSLGYIPPVADHAQIGIGLPGRDFARQLPSYDLRTLGRVTPVKDQGLCGSCWTFGTIASLEGWLLTAGETWDLSENNLKECHPFTWGPCYGGNADISTAYFAYRSGPVSEADDLYYDYVTGCSSGLTIRKYLRKVMYLTSADVSGIKDAIMGYGPLYMAFYYDSAYYNSDNHTYYYPGAASGSNHVVAIVGWDDNFDRNLFPGSPPLGNGAWICKNSWGTDWGEGGYFYQSYYDTYAAADPTLFFDAQDPDDTSVYQYDPLGWVYNLGYGGTTAWAANTFTTTQAGYLSRVAFYTNEANAAYTVYIKRGGPDGTEEHSQGSTFTYAGYHTVDLTSPVSLSNGETFSVVVSITNPSYNYPAVVEGVYTGYSDGATASAGQSSMSPDGAPGNWYDISDSANEDPPYNNCIKAFVWPADTSAVFRVSNLGNVYADGAYYGAGFYTGSADVAEWVAVSEPVEPGDVLELDPDHAGHYRKSRGPCSTLVAGVVSTDPGFVLGSAVTDHSSPITDSPFSSSTLNLARRTSNSALLALIGIVPMKVTDEGGPIEPGDLLTTSSTPGYAMKWNQEDGTACGLVGKALEPFNSGTGIIQVLLMR